MGTNSGISYESVFKNRPQKNQQTKPKPGVLIITQESLRALLFNINN